LDLSLDRILYERMMHGRKNIKLPIDYFRLTILYPVLVPQIYTFKFSAGKELNTKINGLLITVN